MSALTIIGGGRMGAALAGGLLDAGRLAVADLRVVEPSGARRETLASELPGVTLTAELGDAQDVVIAVKPDVVLVVAEQLASSPPRRVLSIAAGIRLAEIERVLVGVPVLRAMPNTPALVGEGAAALAAGTVATDHDLAWATSILQAVGIVVSVPESQLDAVTGLSGSGPAYVFLVAEALVDAGVLNGLSRDTAEALTAQTILGAARLLSQPDADAATLRGAVTSPGGTTAAGLAAMESAGVRAGMLDAVSAATNRSQELSG